MRLFSLDSMHLDLTDGRDGVDAIVQKERRQIIEEELSSLSSCEREALAAYARMTDESCRGVARRYGKHHQTVCNWAATAMKKLKPKLRKLL